MKQKRPYVLYLVILLIIAVTTINVIFTFQAVNDYRTNNENIFSQLTGMSQANSSRIKESEETLIKLADLVAEIQNEKDPIKNGIDGKDGSDGKDGADGKDGVSIKGDTGEAGRDGFTPELRCNELRNRWEVRYSEDGAWELLGNQVTKCTVTKQDIIDAFKKH